ncbi:MAG TPA: hypothetical protein VG426_01905 [Candidatus Dormibacteraeota bacterium]|jgi:hypothetical protein|nr:hypothetical protein [Candidatus Dormibacteraeota bacterium]
MADRGRYDSAMFWLAFGTAAAVIGLALMSIGVSRSAAGGNLLTSLWFDCGLGLLGVGALLLLLALSLYLARRRVEANAAAKDSSPDAAKAASPDQNAEMIRGYYSERERLLKIWERQERNRRPKR